MIRGREDSFLGALGFVYLPTYIGGFLPAGRPPAVSRGEYIPARRFTGVWLGESQEACALLTMTNCPALRRHIYANLSARVESPPPRTYEFTRVLLPLLDASRRLILPSCPSFEMLCTGDSTRHRKFGELQILPAYELISSHLALSFAIDLKDFKLIKRKLKILKIFYGN